MGRWQCRCTRIQCSRAASRWRPYGQAAGLYGLSADLVHGGKALCVAGRRCIENIELTCARPSWPPAPWGTYKVQRSGKLWLCGWAPQCKCSGGNATSVSGAWWVQGHSADHRYTPPPPHRAPGSQDGVRGGHPGERVGARGGGRRRARGWHTRGTARHRQGGQTYRQGRQGEGEWEGRQARERAQGSGTRIARRRAGGTRRARGSSKEREHRTKYKKTAAGQADTQEGHKEEAG